MTCVCISAGCLTAQTKAPSDYLYVWTASTDTTKPDFLAVFDARSSSPSYGRLITTVPVPGHRNRPHHTEYETRVDQLLFANGFATGQTFIFDTKTPEHPKLAEQFGDVAGMMHPHSFIRLPTATCSPLSRCSTIHSASNQGASPS